MPRMETRRSRPDPIELSGVEPTAFASRLETVAGNLDDDFGRIGLLVGFSMGLAPQDDAFDGIDGEVAIVSVSANEKPREFWLRDTLKR